MPAKSHDSVAVIGIDLGKNVFHLIGSRRFGARLERQLTSAGIGQPYGVTSVRAL